ncbi:hypothetical protein TNCV_705561 [Trichonephila clavipes]|nr:hypothetical protein TNCV_705561 [Trichonephila clavipes]
MQYHGVGRHHDQWPHAPTCGCVNGTMTGQRYIDEVLLPHVRLFHVRLVAEAFDLPRYLFEDHMRAFSSYAIHTKLQHMKEELLPHNFKRRLDICFSLQFLARLEVDPEWPWNILWTEEAHFHLTVR